MTNPTTLTATPGLPYVDTVREFEATPEQLFRAQTDPDLVAQWLGPRELEMTVLEYDVRPGGSYRYIHTDPASGTEYVFRGVFHTVEKATLLIQTFEWEGAPGQVSLDTSRYEDLGGRTRLHQHSVFPSVEVRDAMVSSGMERGVVDSMNRLDELLAGAGLPR
ncbi:SRPBCC family protein [Subtercola lobariae]|uniref:ATPase n=1 Tax=Subtercola lobariae TaxID=1588641 RepID=A0A917BBH5_9MICO|nr:SRPBCC family protein [Subtercola lobariae]GGF34156.1 ATPase [Subtercola lobariae]